MTQESNFAPEAPCPIGIAQTLAFVLKHIQRPASILEVGAGKGQLAHYLQKEGFELLAIDADPQAVESARSLGINVQEAEFLNFQSKQQYDALIFSRSFHHIQPLEKTLAKCKSLLKPGGLLLLEEFAAEEMDEQTALWFFGLVLLVSRRNPERKMHGPKLENFEIPKDVMKSWNEHHFGKHHVASAAQMRAAVAGELEILVEERGPYLYLYFWEYLSPQEAEDILRWEERLCSRGFLQSIGYRIVAAKAAQ
ncbi:MAG: class I SAM-dependent methyltransferase [Candidatus Obscuribacterales bacterium]|nr:class I SAM-dependent methyltransferase [Candidatus Obscuribacterales bacterium]